MKRLAILGASGHGKVIADTAELCGWEKIAFFDDAFPRFDINGAWPILGSFKDLLQQLPSFDAVFVAIGNNRVRLAKLNELLANGADIATLIHPAACVSRYANIGVGSVILAGAVVNAYADINLGCILNTHCSVDHDCIVGRAVHISPGGHLAGAVVIGEASWVGIGACVRQLVVIGRDVMVGAGAAVVSDVPDDATFCGVPARLK